MAIDSLVRPFARLLLAGALLTGCAEDGAETASVSSDLDPPSSLAVAAEPIDPSAWFSERAEEAGLRFAHFNGMSGEFYFPEMIPAGVALLDYDNDGDLDVYLVQGRMLGDGMIHAGARMSPGEPLPLKGRLYRNDLHIEDDGSRSLRFTDVTDESRIDAPGYGMGVATGDFTNDGCVDIYLTNFGPNQLFRNNCAGVFTDVSRESGTDDPGWGVSASFVDYDRDGWLDLYVGNYVQYLVQADRPCTGLTGRRDYCTPDVYLPQVDRLYRNQRDGRFVDVTSTALMGAEFGPALGVSTADLNGDEWIDIYVTNDGRDNLLWVNQRNGTFQHLGLLSGAAVSGDGRQEGSMGVDAGDFDNDGDTDLFMTHLPAEGNNLYVNDGTGLFEDVSGRTGLGPSSLGYTGFGAAWFDVDNDGWLDILAVNGAIEAVEGREDELFPYDERNLLFRNLRSGRFEDVTDKAGSALALSEVSRGAAFGDIDNDGDTDVVVSNNNGPVRLLVNEVGSRKHWLGLRLVGDSAPRDMLGARVAVIRSDGSTRWRRARADGSYASANDPRVLVGLGESEEPPQVRVVWPQGRVENWTDLAVDRYTTLTEGQGADP